VVLRVAASDTLGERSGETSGCDPAEKRDRPGNRFFHGGEVIARNYGGQKFFPCLQGLALQFRDARNEPGFF
jgi:hypothetical protein